MRRMEGVYVGGGEWRGSTGEEGDGRVGGWGAIEGVAGVEG